ncbi:MAG: hypothetical protein EHM28_09615 [Spirochaetaceae bacterium]|nr:MAG: hypothetical protein EHM28_09615 [Spirochaetaceae bacterium]
MYLKRFVAFAAGMILFVLLIFDADAQNVKINKVEILQGTDENVTFNFYDLVISGMRRKSIQFTFVLTQNEQVFDTSWVMVDPVTIPYDTATWSGKAIWFYYPLMFVSQLGNNSQPYTGYLIIKNTESGAIVHKQPVQFTLEAMKREISEDGAGNIVSSFNWVYDKKLFSGEFVISKNERDTSIQERDKFQPATGRSSYENGYIMLWETSFEDFYKDLYGFLYTKNTLRLENVKKVLLQIKEENNLSYNQFAEMVICCVQSTVYLLPDEPYGIFTPLELMAEQEGDCDSRSVLLYILLKDFGYDVVIMYSEKYEHAMLGIAYVGGIGEYLTHKGKKYYFVETTAPGWIIGNIPPEWSDKRYWEVLIPQTR